MLYDRIANRLTRVELNSYIFSLRVQLSSTAIMAIQISSLFKIATPESTWVVPEKYIMSVEDRNWLKLQASSYGLCKLVMAKLPQNPTLSNTPGLLKLLEIRAAACTSALEQDGAGGQPAKSLFEGSPMKKKRK